MTQLASSGTAAERPGRMSYEEFLAAAQDVHAEWVDGEVVPMMAVSREHAQIKAFLLHMVRAFVEQRSLGVVLDEPFQMKTGPDLPGRSPDLIFVATAGIDRILELYLDGPADLVVEIISPGSGARDRGDKYYEYEQGGVREYWLIDPARQVAEFYQLDAGGRYRVVTPDAGDVYRSVVLPGLWLRTAWLWSRPPVQGLLEEIATD